MRLKIKHEVSISCACIQYLHLLCFVLVQVVFVANKLVPLTITLWNKTQVGAQGSTLRVCSFR